MTDLTKAILKAKSYLQEQKPDYLISMINRFSDVFGFCIEWDKEDGEQWGRILLDTNVVAMFHASLPLIFVDSQYHNTMIEHFKNKNITDIVVQEIQSWDKNDYSINITMVSNIIEWHSSTISKNNFSINEFWYATV